MTGTYTESRWGKEAFVDEIINTVVRQGGYSKALYVYNEGTETELVLIYPLGNNATPISVDVTADSCCALLCDVIRKLGWTNK